jgi:hypothetical protein
MRSCANACTTSALAGIEAAGLRCGSCHYQFKELKENLDERIAFGKELGLKQMVLPTFGLPAGMQLRFHNRNFEFQEIHGVLVYDTPMRGFDAKLPLRNCARCHSSHACTRRYTRQHAKQDSFKKPV